MEPLWKKKFFFPFLKICILDWLILFWNFDLEFFEKRILCSVHGCFWICYLYKPCHQLRSGAMHASNKSLLLSRRNPCPGVLRIEGRVPLIQHSQIGTQHIESEIDMFGRVWKITWLHFLLVEYLFLGNFLAENKHQVWIMVNQNRLPGYDKPDF